MVGSRPQVGAGFCVLVQPSEQSRIGIACSSVTAGYVLRDICPLSLLSVTVCRFRAQYLCPPHSIKALCPTVVPRRGCPDEQVAVAAKCHGAALSRWLLLPSTAASARDLLVATCATRLSLPVFCYALQLPRQGDGHRCRVSPCWKTPRCSLSPHALLTYLCPFSVMLCSCPDEEVVVVAECQPLPCMNGYAAGSLQFRRLLSLNERPVLNVTHLAELVGGWRRLITNQESHKDLCKGQLSN